MKQTIATMCVTLACSAGVSVFAQVPKDQMGQKPMKNDGAMTVSGCVTAGTAAGEFMLTNAMTMGKMMDKEMMDKDKMSKPGMSGDHMMSYQLVGGNNLKAHLGHKVEVMGTMSKMDMDAAAKMDKSKMEKDKTMADRDKMMADKDMMKARKLNVTSFKMISATCP